MTHNILVTGSVAYDVLLHCEASFERGLEAQDIRRLSVAFLAQDYARHHGGTGANIAWNLRLLGADALLVATTGIDGGPYAELLRERGVDTAFLEQRSDAVTATAIIATDDAERQITFFHPGADALGTWPETSLQEEEIAYAIVSPRDVHMMQTAMAWCKENGIPYAFDPGQQLLAFGDDDLRRAIRNCSALIVNNYEWGLLATRLKYGEDDIRKTGAQLIITRGSDGASLYAVNQQLDIPACTPERVINPTGAGDAFRAGWLAGTVAGWQPADCVRLGSAMGSYAVEVEGTLMDALDTQHVWQRAEEAYGAPLPVWEP